MLQHWNAMHNFNLKFLQLWNAGHDAHLTVECWAGKATINLELTLGDKPLPTPPVCQVRPQPRQPGPSRLRRHERRAEARIAAENAADAPKADASEALKKPIGRLTDDTSEKEIKCNGIP